MLVCPGNAPMIVAVPGFGSVNRDRIDSRSFATVSAGLLHCQKPPVELIIPLVLENIETHCARRANVAVIDFRLETHPWRPKRII